MTHTAHALGALLSVVVLSTSSLALAIEPPPQPPPASSEDGAAPPPQDNATTPAPDQGETTQQPDAKAAPHHGCLWSKRGAWGATGAVAPRLVRWGITAGVTTAAAVATTAAVAGAVTLATALPACAANPGACRAVLQAPLSRAPNVGVGANVRAPLNAR